MFVTALFTTVRLKTAQMFINEWKDEQTGVYSHTGILFSYKKWTKYWYTCYNIDEPEKHAKGKNLGT